MALTGPPCASSTSVTTGRVVAVVESRGVGREIGIAALDRNSGRCALTQLQDVQSYWRTTHSLHQRRPSTVVVQQLALTAKAGVDQVSGEPTPLVRSIQSAFENVPVVGIKRQYWSDAIGALPATELATY